jgi:hypothetical protein
VPSQWGALLKAALTACGLHDASATFIPTFPLAKEAYAFDIFGNDLTP